MFQRKSITLAMAATNMEYHQGAIIVYTGIGEEPSCHSVCHTASNQSWTWEWPGNEVNEVMQQLNQSAPDTQSVHIVTMEVACQQLCHAY